MNGARGGADAFARPVPATERLFTRPFAFVMAGTVAAWVAHTTAVVMLSPFFVRLGPGSAIGGLMLGLVSVCALASRFVVGPRIDRVGGRATALGGAALVGLGVMGYLAAATSGLPAWAAVALVAAGAVAHGVGFGSLSTSALTLVDDVAPLSRRGEAVGFYGIIPPIVQGLAATSGFVLVDTGGYGLLFAVVAVFAFGSIGFFALLRPTRAPHPHDAIQPRIVRLDRRILVPVVGVCLVTILSAALVLTVPILSLEVGGFNPGTFFLTSAIVGVVGRLSAGRLSDRVGRARVIVPGMALIALSTVFLVALADLGVVTFAVGGILSGIAFAGVVPAQQAWILDRGADDRRGSSAASMGMAADVGFASGSVLTGLALGLLGTRDALLLASIMPVICLILLAWDLRRPLPTTAAA